MNTRLGCQVIEISSTGFMCLSGRTTMTKDRFSKRFFHSVSFVALACAAAVASAGSVLANDEIEGIEPSTFELFALYMQRSGDDNVLLIEGATTADAALTTDSALDPEGGFGVGAKFSKYISGRKFEFSGFYIGHSSDFGTEELNGGSLNSDWAFTDNGSFYEVESWTGADAAFGNFESHLISGEIMHARALSDQTEVSIGTRLASLRDELNLYSVDEGGLAPLDPNEPSGVMNIDVSNLLLGLQAGAKTTFSPVDRLHLSVGAKAGLFVNFVEKDLHYVSLGEGGDVDANFDDSDTVVSGILEGEFEVAVEATDGIELFAGGQATALLGVATGFSQIPTANTEAEFNKVETDENLIYWGAKAGARVRF